MHVEGQENLVWIRNCNPSLQIETLSTQHMSLFHSQTLLERWQITIRNAWCSLQSFERVSNRSSVALKTFHSINISKTIWQVNTFQEVKIYRFLCETWSTVLTVAADTLVTWVTLFYRRLLSATSSHISSQLMLSFFSTHVACVQQVPSVNTVTHIMMRCVETVCCQRVGTLPV